MVEKAINIYDAGKEQALQNILNSFGIKTQFITLKEGRFFDTYDVKLQPGIRSTKIDKILVDLGMQLSSKAIPIGRPNLSSGTYQIDVQRALIKAPEVYNICQQMPASFFAPIPIGIDANGNNICADMASMPNLLIAGTTGSGKSSTIHNFILASLKKGATVSIVDPKRVEFDVYSDLKQVERIVSEPDSTLDLLEALIETMESRFDLLKSTNSRSVIEHNTKALPNKIIKPYLLIIDEWADISLRNKPLQDALVKLTQKSRAAGIYTILGTQRPSANVISGNIKANFPARIALRVSSAVDSRVIIDSVGAEKIDEPGMGLYLDPYVGKPILFKAPYIKDLELELQKFSLEKKKNSFWKRLFQ